MRSLTFLALVAAVGVSPMVARAQGAIPILPGGAAKGPINITAPSLDYLDREHKLVYSGGVVATQGEATLKASSLTILLNDGPGLQQAAAAGGADVAGGNQIKRIEAAGPISIVSKNQVGTGDSGVYDRAANKLTLAGNVTLSQCANVLKGDRLIYDLVAGRATVQGRVSSLLTPGVSCDDGKKGSAPEKPTSEKPAAAARADRKPRR